MATGATLGAVSALLLGVLDLARGHYVEGIIQVILIVPLQLLMAYWLYRRAQRS